MNTQQLKQKILDLAIRGQLVPQDSNDEPASVLLEKIRAEKQALIEQKKIKKDKKSSYITCEKSPYQKNDKWLMGNDQLERTYIEHFSDGTTKDITQEIPFEIPENWAWCRLGEVGEIISGGTPSTANDDYWNGDISWITPADLSNYKEKYIGYGKRNISVEGLENSSAKIIRKGSVLFSSRAPIGYVAISEREVATNQGFKSVSPYIENLEHYIYYFLLTEKENISLKASGTTFKELSGTEFGKIIFPLPPLAEQQRIVAKVEELLALVEDLETNKTNLKSYIQQTKAKVLDMAIRGQLVPQNPDDEPASVLLERIKNEQATTKPKGKKTTHNTHYDNDKLSMVNEEMPFDIPKNWAWCRLGEVYDLLNGFAFKSNDYIEFSNTLVFRMSQIRPGGGIDFDNNPKYVSDEFAISKKEFLLKKGDVVIAMTDMATDTKILGVPTQIPYDKRNWLLNQRVGKLFEKEKNILEPTFLKNVLISDFMNKYYKTFGKGGVQINIGKQDILNAQIPLPPLSEQKRIVQKIEKIFSELNAIEENLT